MSRSVSEIRAIIEQNNPSLILTSSPSPYLALEVLKANRRLHAPLVFDVRDIWPYEAIAGGGSIRNAIKKRVERRCARGANLVLAVTDGVKDMVIERHGLAPDKVVVVTNGVDLELFKVRAAEKTWDLVILGAAAKYRNFENAFRAFSILLKRRPETRILYIGWERNAYTIGLEKIAESLGLFPALELRPPVPLDHLSTILSAGRIGFISQTWDEMMRVALPVKSFEYMAAGLPLACLGPPGDCGVSKLVRETGAGIYVSTPEEMALEIEKLLNDHDRMAVLTDAAIRAARLYNRAEIVRRTYDRYLVPLMKRRGG